MAQEPSKACCTTPVAVAGPYTEKGTWETIDGLKTYITGPSTSKKGIVFIYDALGYSPQSLQGADMLSQPNTTTPYLVASPDFFRGDAFSPTWLPMDTPEKKEKAMAFLSGPADTTTNTPVVHSVAAALRARYPSVERWAAVGFCWGGKMVALTCGDGTPFVAGAQCHPARVDRGDAGGVRVPFAVLASGDEPAEEVEAFKRGLRVECHVETFEDQVHGWMGARADLEDERVRAEYERGYKVVLDFFAQHV